MSTRPRDRNRAAIEQLIRELAAHGRAPTALGEAARWGRLDLALELLDGGLAVDGRTETGHTPLMMAASGGHPRVVALLLARGADPNAAGPDGRTPLIWCLAALHRARVYLAVARALLGAGASPAARGADGRTALDWARDGRPDEVARLIEQHQAAAPAREAAAGRTDG